jgi:hypothetical protein
MKMKLLPLSEEALEIVAYIAAGKGPNHAMLVKDVTDAACDGSWLGMVGASQDAAEDIYNALFGEGFESVVVVDGGLAAFRDSQELNLWLAQA